MWLGDILLNATLAVTLETTGGGSNITSIASRSWFASLFELWRYIVADFNTDLGEETRIELTEAGDIVIAADGGNVVSIAVTGDYTILGLPSATVNPGTPTYTIASGALVPCFGPVASYSRAFKVESGYMDRACDGTLYSVAGKVQELRDIEVTLDNRDLDYAEVDLWLALWHSHWSLGRSVTLYLNPVASHVAAPDAAACEGEVLVTPSEHSFENSRLIEYTNATPMLTTGVTFAHKAFFPLSGSQNLGWVV